MVGSWPVLSLFTVNPLPYPGNVVGAVHGRRGTQAAARGAPGAAWYRLMAPRHRLSVKSNTQ